MHCFYLILRDFFTKRQGPRHFKTLAFQVGRGLFFETKTTPDISYYGVVNNFLDLEVGQISLEAPQVQLRFVGLPSIS